MYEHEVFDHTIDEYERFNNGAYSHADHVAHTRGVVTAGQQLLRALGAPPENNDPLQEAALWALQHFEQMDVANGAIHCAPVRYSPITFRLARALRDAGVADHHDEVANEIHRVLEHDGAYEEDTGR